MSPSTTRTRPPHRPRPASPRPSRPRPHPAIARRRRAVRGLPSRGQALAAGAAGLACAIAGYWLATGPMLAVHGVRVSGYDRADAPQLRAAVERAASRGGSLLSPPIAAVRRQAVVFPWVQDVSIARDWPVGIVVQVTQAKPIAIGVPARGGRVLISARGLIMGPAGATRGLPRIKLPGEAPAVGLPVPAAARGPVALVRYSDPATAARFRALRLERGRIVGTLTAGPDLVVGPPVRLRAKALAIQAILNWVSAEDERRATYLDVTVPERPALGGMVEVPVVTPPAAPATPPVARPDPAAGTASPTASGTMAAPVAGTAADPAAQADPAAAGQADPSGSPSSGG